MTTDAIRLSRAAAIQPTLDECRAIDGRLTQLADRIDILPSQVGASAEFLFLQALESIKRAKIATVNACETLRQIIGNN
mgnify:FL=1